MKANPTTRAHAKSLRKTMTSAERILWSSLRSKQINGWQFRKQHPIGPYIADFVCAKAKLVIEVDGATHSTDAEIAYDQKRTAFLQSSGWTVYRVLNSDIYNNLTGVLDGIFAHLPSPK